jgi:KTSC domain
MQRIQVKSSMIRSIGYNAETLTLEVEYNGGTLYHYEGVAPDQYKAIMEAESVGKYFNQIRKNFPYKALTLDEQEQQGDAYTTGDDSDEPRTAD